MDAGNHTSAREPHIVNFGDRQYEYTSLLLSFFFRRGRTGRAECCGSTRREIKAVWLFLVKRFKLVFEHYLWSEKKKLICLAVFLNMLKFRIHIEESRTESIEAWISHICPTPFFIYVKKSKVWWQIVFNFRMQRNFYLRLLKLINGILNHLEISILGMSDTYTIWNIYMYIQKLKFIPYTRKKIMCTS